MINKKISQKKSKKFFLFFQKGEVEGACVETFFRIDKDREFN